MNIGDKVRWLECPPYMWMFAETRVKSIDGAYARIEWVRHPVAISELTVLR